MMLASHALPRPSLNPFEREAEQNAARKLPAPDGLIAAVPLRLAALNFRRIYAGTFGPLTISSFQDHVRQFANFLHVSVSFVARFHEVKPMGQGIPDDGKSTAQSRNLTAEYGNGAR